MSVGEILTNVITEHFQTEKGLQIIAVFSQKNEQKLCLIEVNEEALPTGQVEPFVFAAKKTAPLLIYIADVTPNEWEAIRRKEIPLPQGWPTEPFQIFRRDQEV